MALVMSDVELLFLCFFFFFWPSVRIFLEEMPAEVFCPFFDCVVFLILSSMSCLFILQINPLSVA